jgi:hypothetical protein
MSKSHNAHYDKLAELQVGLLKNQRFRVSIRGVLADLRRGCALHSFAAVRSVVGTAARRGSDVYQAIRAVLYGESVLLPGWADTHNEPCIR